LNPPSQKHATAWFYHWRAGVVHHWHTQWLADFRHRVIRHSIPHPLVWFGLDYKHAVAYTLVMVGVFWNGAGAVTVGLLSDIKWDWLIALLLGSFIGGYIGSHLAILKGNTLIKRSYEIITILIGLKLLFG